MSEGVNSSRFNGDENPKDASKFFNVEDRGWDLSVEDGVLTGEITYGCANDAIACQAAAKQLVTINESGKININFKWVEGGADITFETLDHIPTDSGQRALGMHVPLGNRWLGFGGPMSKIQILNGYQNNQATILHEFGHALGAPHQFNSTNSTMSYSESESARSNFSPYEVDQIISAYR